MCLIVSSIYSDSALVLNHTIYEFTLASGPTMVNPPMSLHECTSTIASIFCNVPHSVVSKLNTFDLKTMAHQYTERLQWKGLIVRCPINEITYEAEQESWSGIYLAILLVVNIRCKLTRV